MNIFHVAQGKPEQFTPKQEQVFEVANNLFCGVVVCVLDENIVHVYISLSYGKEMWEALEENFGDSNAGSKLYIID